MEQLIIDLEKRINWLTEQLLNANKEISRLKEESRPTVEPRTEPSASMDLLQHMADQQNEDPVQLYIKDSLGLLETNDQTQKTQPVEYQLNFDLSLEDVDTMTNNIQSTTIEQNIDMSTQQPEPNSTQLNDDKPSTKAKAVDTQEQALPSTGEATLTPEQKKRQKNQKNNRRLIKMLEDRYPKAFDWNQPKPLKVGIDQDMTLDEDFNTSKQKRALAAYTRSDRYKKCLLSGQPRVDLEGVAVNNEPALPESMIPAKSKPAKAKPANKPAHTKGAQQARNNKVKSQPKSTPNNKAKKSSKQDDIYDNLSPEERMKAKLEKLLNKS